jgi:hypothetical protein
MHRVLIYIVIQPDGRVFPVEIDAIGVEIVAYFLYRPGEFGSSLCCEKTVGTILTSAPSAHGQDHFQVRVRFFQADHFFYDGAVPCIGDPVPVTIQMPKAKYQLRYPVHIYAIQPGDATTVIGNYFHIPGLLGAHAAQEKKAGNEQEFYVITIHCKRALLPA